LLLCVRHYLDSTKDIPHTSKLIEVTQLQFLTAKLAKNAKIFSTTLRILGDFINRLGELGLLAVQVRKSYI